MFNQRTIYGDTTFYITLPPTQVFIFPASISVSNSSRAVHNFESLKFLITNVAPAFDSNFSGFLRPKPTTGIPAATPAFIPEIES